MNALYEIQQQEGGKWNLIKKTKAVVKAVAGKVRNVVNGKPKPKPKPKAKSVAKPKPKAKK